MPELRDYQRHAVALLRANLHQRPVLCMPTGSGKTAVAAEVVKLAHAKGKRTLFLCDRREILLKTAADFEACGVPTGIVLSGRVQKDRPHLVAAAQTLAHRDLPPADLLIVDEAHRSLAPTQERIVRHYDTRIALTATPLRNDGLGLGRLYGTIIEPHPVRWYIDNGYLAQYRYIAPVTADLKGVKRVRGDFEPREATARASERHVVAGAIDAYKKHLAGKPAILFAVTRDHSRAMAEAFRAAGIPAAHCDGDTGKVERAQALRDLVSGSLHVLCNVDLWGYGVDVRGLQGAILLRPTQSLTVARQQVGRPLRPPGPATILDLVGNVFRHGLPDDPVAWSLEDGLTENRSPGVRTCGMCFAIFQGPGACPSCGNVNVGATVVVRAHEAELREVKVSPPKPPVPDALKRLLAEAHRENRRPGFARFAYQRQHHYFPKGDWTKAVAEERNGCLMAGCRFCA